jgi:hypothetical protein
MPKRFRLKGDVRFRAVAGEGVVLRQETAKVLVVNQLGVRILEVLEHADSVTEIADRLIEEYKVERDTLEADIGAYLQDLVERGVVDAQGDGEEA